MKRIILVLVLLLWTAAPLVAMTVEDAVKLALQNNHIIREQVHLYNAQGHRVKSQRADFFPDLNLVYSFTRQDNFFFFQTEESSVASVEAKYNLFRGFIDVNELREAKSLHGAYSYQKKAIEADIKFRTRATFIELLRAKKNLEIAEEAVELLTRQKREASLFYQEGMIAKDELLKVDVELASARQEFLRAQSSVKIAEDELERIIGITIDTEEDIEDMKMPVIRQPDFDMLADTMFTGRSELKYLQALKLSREFKKSGLKGEYFPTVDISLKYSQFGDSASPSGRAGLYDNETRTMVTAEWEIFDISKKRHEVRAEDAEVMAVEERIKDLREELLFQLKNAIEDNVLAWGKLDVASKAIEQAEENYRITENKFRQQVVKATELIDARVFLSRARNDFINAFYDLHLAAANIERVIEGVY